MITKKLINVTKSIEIPFTTRTGLKGVYGVYYYEDGTAYTNTYIGETLTRDKVLTAHEADNLIELYQAEVKNHDYI